MSHSLSSIFTQAILSCTSATSFQIEETVQELWSGYGKILRLRLDDGRSVITKHVRLPSDRHHPRGWNGLQSHQRKLRSYEVETSWYRDWSPRCDDHCRVPECLALEREGEEILLVLEDLDAAGFPVRAHHASPSQVDACLSWLAHFHATFMGTTPEGLWETGTYWHLATRREELEALDDEALKQAASGIDETLNRAKYQTLVHGDAKLANFCFDSHGSAVAAVDFQYVGGGCGIKDLAYFIGSCLDETQCEAQETALLDRYFELLRHALEKQESDVDSNALEQEWRSLFPVAWTDFHRFLKGWSPGHWKINSYSERLAREVVGRLMSG